MNIVIAGAGTIGKYIINKFASYGYSITVIDKSRDIINFIIERENINVIIGDACDPSILKKAGLETAYCFIATTSSDSTNIMVGSLAKKMFNVQMVISRVKYNFLSEDRLLKLFFKENFLIDHIVTPNYELAKRLYELVIFNDVYDYAEMGEMAICKVKCLYGSDVANTPLQHLKNLTSNVDIKIISINRNGKSILFPDEKEVLLAEDMVYIATEKRQMSEVLSAFGIDNSKSNLAITGLNDITKILANMLQNKDEYDNRSISIIDNYHEISDFWINKNVDIIDLNIADTDCLQEINMETYNTLIAATNDEKQNVLSALAAVNNGAGRAIVLTNDYSYNSLITANNKNIGINRGDVICSRIVDLIHSGDYRSLRDKDIIVATIEAVPTCPHVNDRLAHVFHAVKFMALFVYNDNRVMAVNNQYVIHPNDKLVIAVKTQDLGLFEKSWIRKP